MYVWTGTETESLVGELRQRQICLVGPNCPSYLELTPCLDSEVFATLNKASDAAHGSETFAYSCAGQEVRCDATQGSFKHGC
jgi:hypothetical protein